MTQSQSAWELAQINVGRMVAPIDSPVVAGFVENLERINALADRSPGFVWRLQTDAGDATEFRLFDEDTLVNMSVWKDVDSLHHFVYRTAHVEIMRRRKEWFELMREAYQALWWVPRGIRPSLQEAGQRLQRLRESGPCPEAFTFKQAFPQPGTRQLATSFDDSCPAY